MTYRTIKVDTAGTVCRIRLDRPEAKNSLNELLVAELLDALDRHQASVTVVVLEGLPDYFCFGADFQELTTAAAAGERTKHGPERLYELFLRLATGPFVTVAHVRGVANAGGVGLVAASDIVIADDTARFSLSELLFGLYPACVLPFLIRRCGSQKAHYMTLMTMPFDAATAASYGLVDATGPNGEALLRRHLTRLKCLPASGIARYKRYLHALDDGLTAARSTALAGNREVFSDERNLTLIRRYTEEGILPWEA
ncbi:enoyl-CoA hydratase/isomerase [Streptomyces sp. enrichment culture]|uniref:enoyl-CoA hydratase/isomerase n=1 Tax=Streptomyces sp. enrichment culture TaxID=1795815 RepID=UPI003F5656D0